MFKRKSIGFVKAISHKTNKIEVHGFVHSPGLHIGDVIKVGDGVERVITLEVDGVRNSSVPPDSVFRIELHHIQANDCLQKGVVLLACTADTKPGKVELVGSVVHSFKKIGVLVINSIKPIYLNDRLWVFEHGEQIVTSIQNNGLQVGGTLIHATFGLKVDSFDTKTVRKSTPVFRFFK